MSVFLTIEANRWQCQVLIKILLSAEIILLPHLARLYLTVIPDYSFIHLFQTNQEKAAEKGKQSNLLPLFGEIKMRKQQSPQSPLQQCPAAKTRSREKCLSDTFSEDDDGAVVPQRVSEEPKEKQRLYQNKFKEILQKQLEPKRSQDDD